MNSQQSFSGGFNGKLCVSLVASWPSPGVRGLFQSHLLAASLKGFSPMPVISLNPMLVLMMSVGTLKRA
jgi:hypothetical protein